MIVISNRNASLYCEQLATLIGAGVPLDRALTTLTRSAPSRGLRRISSDVKRRINGGETFTQALTAHTRHLPQLMVSFFEVGERAGRLDEVARSLATYYQGQWELARTTTAQLVPTLFYFVMCLAVIVFIQYVRSGWNTAVLARAAEQAAFVAACLALVVLAIKALPPVRAAIVLVASALPFISGVMRQYAVARFTLSMQVALAAGLDVRRAIALSAGAMANPILAPRARRAAKSIDEGLTITQALERTGVFGRDEIGMFEAGELTGRMPETMGHVAVTSRFRATTAARAATKVFTIAVYVAVIVYIGYTVVSMYLQHYSGLFRLLEPGGE